MELTYHGNSCVRLRGRDTVVLVDPQSNQNSKGGKQPPDIVVRTIPSPDWTLLHPAEGRPQQVSGPGEYEIRGVAMRGLQIPDTIIICIEVDDIHVVALGAVKDQLTDDDVDALGHVDVLVVPVGGGERLNAVGATKLVNAVEPAVVIPVHYRGDVLDTLDPVDKFAKEMGMPDGWTAQPKLNLMGSSGSSEETRVVVLEPRPL